MLLEHFVLFGLCEEFFVGFVKREAFTFLELVIQLRVPIANKIGADFLSVKDWGTNEVVQSSEQHGNALVCVFQIIFWEIGNSSALD